MTSRPVPQAAIDLIKQFEGFVPTPYKDPVDIDTIGYGHVIKPYEKFTSITEQEGEALLRQDVSLRAKWVLEDIRVPLNDNQFSALCSLVFNCGTGPLHGTIAKLLNAADYTNAALEFPKWNHAGGKVVDGLTRRRQAEQALFETPVEVN